MQRPDTEEEHSMVKKLKAMADKKSTPSGAACSTARSRGSVKESAQQIWLAGMGAFAKAQAEGTQVFDALVKEGISLQKKTQGAAEEKISEVTEQDDEHGRRRHRQGRPALGQARVDLRAAHRQGA